MQNTDCGMRHSCTRSLSIQSLALVFSLCLRVSVVSGVSVASGTDNHSDADYAAHLAALKQKAPAGFAIVEQRPFFVIGDESPATVRQHAERTIKWAADKLRQDYFTQDPAEILDIWLFKDGASYEKYARELFGEKPSTPFGYYSARHRALIMNISTGGGTLVHELVHPFMRANFPECPVWFNEGLASLYEQSGEKEGHITGYTNWRLAGLQKAISDGKLLSFEALTALPEVDFYNGDKSANYAQARYLCYYLQENGLLVKFFRRFQAAAKTDPTGCKTLRQVLGEPDMDAFKKKWEAFVLGLRFP